MPGRRLVQMGDHRWTTPGSRSVAPRHPFDSGQGPVGPRSTSPARYSELIVPGRAVFTSGLADPTKSANQARSATVGVDWFPQQERAARARLRSRLVQPRPRRPADKPDENSIITPVSRRTSKRVSIKRNERTRDPRASRRSLPDQFHRRHSSRAACRHAFAVAPAYMYRDNPPPS